MRHPKSGIRDSLVLGILVWLAPGIENALADDFMLTMPKLSSWLEAYGNAWETRDADAAVLIFSEDATYRVSPYEEAHVGRSGIHEYWAGVTENQRNVDFQYQALSVNGNTGIAHWSAEFSVEPGGTTIQLDGIFVLDFDSEGKCHRLREWWHLKADDAASED